jgi:hypothetical protein
MGYPGVGGFANVGPWSGPACLQEDVTRNALHPRMPHCRNATPARWPSGVGARPVTCGLAICYPTRVLPRPGFLLGFTPPRRGRS